MGKLLKIIIALVVIAVAAFIIRSIFFANVDVENVVEGALERADTVVEGEEYIPNIDVTDPVEPETPTDEVKNEEVNPETSDGILLFLGLTIVGFAGVALTYRRLHN